MDMQRYSSLGVSSDKEEVHKAIEKLDKGLFPNAFCKVLPDTLNNDDDFVNLIHADTAGTKTSLAYLYWKETGNYSIWRGIAQDALVMNLDDLACVACTENIIISSTIGRNKHLIPGAVLEEIILGTQAFLNQMEEYGIHIKSGGGETADVGDIVRTIDVGITAFTRMRKSDVLVNDIKAGDVIIGLASFGQTIYESQYNSGIGSNGLTAARHDLLNKKYASFSESYAPETSKENIYTGPFMLSDKWVDGSQDYTIGELLLSPTRSYLPVLKKIIEACKPEISGLIHCTGGAQTKVKKFISNCRVVKDQLFDLPPLFKLLEKHSLCTPRELYQVYNMGHRLEIYCKAVAVDQILDICALFGLQAQIIGHVEAAPNSEVLLRSHLGEFRY
ncbi:MAG: phosphoribosylformylglycinamidine cyclo-ligase [Saprospiraceae bacterium]|nr:phosphoribosylformylglycinamidine cyclo-ligase [Saprospiraceae bacterium]